MHYLPLAVPEHGRPALLGFADLIPPACGRAEGVSQGYVVSVGEQLLHGLGVAFDELLSRPLEAFEYPVEIIHFGHLGLTSTSDPPSFLEGRSSGASYAIQGAEHTRFLPSFALTGKRRR